MCEEDEEALHVDVELVRGKVIHVAGARDNALVRFHHQYEKHPVTLCSTHAHAHAHANAHALLFLLHMCTMLPISLLH